MNYPNTTDVPAKTAMSDLPDNLRILCSYYPSISHVCRKLGLNRSQFNRYLSGATKPSDFVLRRICNFFGLEAFEIYMPHSEFKRLISDKPQIKQLSQTTEVSVQSHLDKLLKSSRADIQRYNGFYYEYYYSMTYPDKILRTLVRITNQGEQPVFTRYECLDEPGCASSSRFRYEGVLYFLQDRIFLIDYETLTLSEITQTILYPCFFTKIDYLSGVKLGVSAACDRPPQVRNVIYERLGEEADLRAWVKNTGLFSESDTSITENLKRYLKATPATKQDAFEATTGLGAMF